MISPTPGVSLREALQDCLVLIARHSWTSRDQPIIERARLALESPPSEKGDSALEYARLEAARAEKFQQINGEKNAEIDSLREQLRRAQLTIQNAAPQDALTRKDGDGFAEADSPRDGSGLESTTSVKSPGPTPAAAAPNPNDGEFGMPVEHRQFDKPVLLPDLQKLVGRFETALGQAWVADCQSATSDKRLKAVWANVEEKRNDLLAALRLLPSATLPSEPTQEMIEAGKQERFDCFSNPTLSVEGALRRIYKAMIDAAPSYVGVLPPK